MKTKLISYLSCFVACLFLSSNIAWANEEDDKSNYWILEDFEQFEEDETWIIDNKDYPTYPNDVKLKTYYANIEKGDDCAFGQNVLRIRGLWENGSAQFTVPNAKRVVLRLTGKKKDADRIIRIYKNGQLVKTYSQIDKYNCIEFIDEEATDQEVTYKITAGTEESTDPIVLYYVEVQKYDSSITPPTPPVIDYDKYWIYDDFGQMTLEEGVYNKTKNYKLYPGDIELKTDSANVERGEGCSGTQQVLRVRGYYFKTIDDKAGGKIEFTVPNTKKTVINVSGKSTANDRTVRIYRNNVLVKTYVELDRKVCEQFVDNQISSSPVTYRIVSGADSEKPIIIKSIYVEKDDTNALEEVVSDTRFDVYPNPASDIIYFTHPVQHVRLLDMNGLVVAESFEATSMNVSQLSKGFYLVELTSLQGKQTQKLVIR